MAIKIKQPGEINDLCIYSADKDNMISVFLFPHGKTVMGNGINLTSESAVKVIDYLQKQIDKIKSKENKNAN